MYYYSCLLETKLVKTLWADDFKTFWADDVFETSWADDFKTSWADDVFDVGSGYQITLHEL